MRFLNISQLSEITGKDRRTIKKRLSELPVHPDSKNAHVYDAHLAIPLIFQIKNSPDNLLVRQEEEQLRLTEAKADLAVMEVEIKRGELVPVSEVADTVEKEYSYVRAQLLSIPSKLAMPLSIETNPALVKDLLEEAITEALAELMADIKYEEKQYNVESSTAIISSESDSTKASDEA